MQITDLLAFGVKNKASDLHLSSGISPMIRVHGDIRRINLPEMSSEEVGTMITSVMNDHQRKLYQQDFEVDFSFELPNVARFRVNAFMTERGPAAVFRTIPSTVLTLEELRAPRIFQKIAENPRGLVLVTGPTGSGKSTTLAAMVNYINETQPAHILTIEDPIEFVHQSKKALINQRELHQHTHSFTNALRSALREVYAAGQRDFGENYIQEWFEKTETLADLPDIVWHVIGDVQSNKTKFVAERAHWVHTIGRLKTARRLSEQRPSEMPSLQVCIEVNIAAEEAKHGVAPDEAVALALEVAKLPNIKVRGLMCVAKADSSDDELRSQFYTMQRLLAELNAAGVEADVLSMGMSGDMPIAVECGATHVRIGSAIFGKRHYPQ